MKDELKKLLLLEEKIYMTYYHYANKRDIESIEKSYPLLKILEQIENDIISNLNDKDISRMYIKLEKLINLERREMGLIDFLIYPASIEPRDICIETLYKRIDFENCKRKKDSYNKEVSGYYYNYYSLLQAEKIYNVGVFNNLLSLKEEVKDASYLPNLKSLILLYGYIIHDSIYNSLIKGNDIYNVIIPNIDYDISDVEYINSFTDEVLFDLLEDSDEVSEILDKIEEIDDEDKSIFINFSGNTSQIDEDLIEAEDKDKILPQVYQNMDWLISYILDSNNQVYDKNKVFYVHLAYNYIKSYTEVDFDDVNRLGLIKEKVESHSNYNKDEYMKSSNLLSSLWNNKTKKKVNKS